MSSKDSWRALLVDVAAIFLGAFVLSGLSGLAVRTLGTPWIQQRNQYIQLKDGQRVSYTSDAELLRLRAELGDKIAGGGYDTRPGPALWVMLFASPVGAILTMAYRFRAKLPGWFSADRRSVVLAIALWPGVIAIGWLNSKLFTVLPSPHADGPIETLAAFSPLAIAVLAVAFVPVAEEAFFRGRLWEVIEAARGRRFAFLSTSIVFAVMHVVLAPAMIIPYLTAGLALGWLRLRTDQLLAPTILHVLNNAAWVAILATSKT